MGSMLVAELDTTSLILSCYGNFSALSDPNYSLAVQFSPLSNNIQMKRCSSNGDWVGTWSLSTTLTANLDWYWWICIDSNLNLLSLTLERILISTIQFYSIYMIPMGNNMNTSFTDINGENILNLIVVKSGNTLIYQWDNINVWYPQH